MASESTVKSLLELKSIQRSARCIDQNISRLVSDLWRAFPPTRNSMDKLLFSPADTVYNSFAAPPGRSMSVAMAGEAARTRESTIAPTPTPYGGTALS